MVTENMAPARREIPYLRTLMYYSFFPEQAKKPKYPLSTVALFWFLVDQIWGTNKIPSPKFKKARQNSENYEFLSGE